MKIILLTDGIWPFVIGGMQKHSYYLCKYLARKKIQVKLVHTADTVTDELISLSCFSEEEKQYIQSVVVEKPAVPKFPGHYLRQAYLHSKRICEQLGDISDVNLIIAKGLTSWYLLKQKNRKVPVAINIHGYEFMQKQPGFRSRMESIVIGFPLTFINRNADFVFSYGGKISGYVRQLGIREERILEFPAALEREWMTEEIKPAQGRRKFVFIGRFERRKGIEELTSVLGSADLDGRFEMHFIGPIPEDKQLKSDHITYHGVVKDRESIMRILQDSHVLMCPSYSEGMPNVIMEGMANGCAIIATDVGATSLVVNDSTGWLIEPANKEQLKKAVSDAILLSDAELDVKRANAWRMIRTDFNWEVVSGKLVDKLNSTFNLTT